MTIWYYGDSQMIVTLPKSFNVAILFSGFIAPLVQARPLFPSEHWCAS